jgi:outer membrane protein OmpA-like peptidoglycan-associated protein
VFYLVPTAAGIIRLDGTTQVHSIYTPDFAGLKPGTAPTTLYADPQGHVVYPGLKQWHLLEENGKTIGEVAGVLPDQGGSVVIDAGPQDTLRLQWLTGTEYGWLLVDPQDFTPGERNTLRVSAAAWKKFIERRVAWQNPSPWFVVEVARDHLTVRHHDRRMSHDIRLPRTLHLIAATVFADRLLLVEPQEVWEVNLSMALQALSPPAMPFLPVAKLPTPGPAQPRPDASVPQRDSINIQRVVYFDSGSAELSSLGKQTLNFLVAELRTYPAVEKITVTGHTDNLGPIALKQKLSRQRAEAVRDYLMHKGVAPDRIETFSMDDTYPIASNATAKGRAENRRAVIDMTLRPPEPH